MSRVVRRVQCSVGRLLLACDEAARECGAIKLAMRGRTWTWPDSRTAVLVRAPTGSSGAWAQSGDKGMGGGWCAKLLGSVDCGQRTVGGRWTVDCGFVGCDAKLALAGTCLSHASRMIVPSTLDRPGN